MRVVVIGGTGLVGSKLVRRLRDRGDEVIAASPTTGVNTITRVGLSKALHAAEVVIDVADAPSFVDDAVLEYFQTSGRNLASAEAAGRHPTPHHPVDRRSRTPPQQRLHARQACPGSTRSQRRASPARSCGRHNPSSSCGQSPTALPTGTRSGYRRHLCNRSPPTTSPPHLLTSSVRRRRTTPRELAGPERIRLADLVEQLLQAQRDTRHVERTWSARYYGSILDDETLVPHDLARIGSTRFEDRDCPEQSSPCESVGPLRGDALRQDLR